MGVVPQQLVQLFPVFGQAFFVELSKGVVFCGSFFFFKEAFQKLADVLPCGLEGIGEVEPHFQGFQRLSWLLDKADGVLLEVVAELPVIAVGFGDQGIVGLLDIALGFLGVGGKEAVSFLLLMGADTAGLSKVSVDAVAAAGIPGLNDLFALLLENMGDLLADGTQQAGLDPADDGFPAIGPGLLSGEQGFGLAVDQEDIFLGHTAALGDGLEHGHEVILSSGHIGVGQGHNHLVAALMQLLDDLEVKVLYPGRFCGDAVDDGVEPPGDIGHVVGFQGVFDELFPILCLIGLQAPGIVQMQGEIRGDGHGLLIDAHAGNGPPRAGGVDIAAKNIVEQGGFAGPGFAEDEHIGVKYLFHFYAP